MVLVLKAKSAFNVLNSLSLGATNKVTYNDLQRQRIISVADQHQSYKSVKK